MPVRRLIIPGRQRPHQVIVLIFATFTGLSIALRQAPEPKSLDSLISPWVLGIWYTLLLIGGVVGLLGSYWRRDPYRGLSMEWASMVMLTFALTLYAIAIFVSAGVAGLSAGGAVLAWAASCAWRWGQIRLDLKTLRQAPDPSDAQ
jgi:uncharacterized membrane protein